MATVNGTTISGGTFYDLCDEATRSYKTPYRALDVCHHPDHFPVILSNCTNRCCNTCYKDGNHKCPGTGDDGTAYSSACPCSCHDDPGLGEVNRDSSIPNIVNIETKLVLSLKIILYSALGSDYDTTLILETGKLYTVKYLTDCGIQTVTGMLTAIDTNIPMTATRYIGESDETIQYCYINMDCSTVGNSDKRMIYINTIRAIEEYSTTTEDTSDNSTADTTDTSSTSDGETTDSSTETTDS